MVISMTGYGRGLAQDHQLSVIVEMKSVNHRFCDITVRLPKQLMVYEDRIKRVVQGKVSRGKIDIFVTIEGEGIVSRSLLVDWELIEQYFQSFKEANQRFSTTEQLSLNQLLKVPEVFQICEKEQQNEALEELIMQASLTAVNGLIEMRRKEGEVVYRDFHNRLDYLTVRVEKIKEVSDEIVNLYRERLLKKVKDFLSGSLEIDESRILTEVAIYADKSDINEELERLTSHILQFRDIIDSNEPIGRKLDFLIQEMNREINTIGSKSNDIKISQGVVDIKSELEKLKEQAQNIE